MQTFKISPSSLTFAWSECQCCYWWKHHGQRQPSMPFPGVFSAMDAAMKRALIGQPAENLGMPAGRIVKGQFFRTTVEPVRGVTLELRGSTDIGVEVAAGVLDIVDNKVAAGKTADHADRYWRQLEAYGLMASNPTKGPAVEVRNLGLLVWSPQDMGIRDANGGWMTGKLRYVNVERRREEFWTFLVEVATLLGRATPPPSTDGCATCALRDCAPRAQSDGTPLALAAV